uniref:Uncharacterized protein n=1 Tax=Anguilla anguilla TaxID=7936 RepID=A0A0E9UZA1_ANGAN
MFKVVIFFACICVMGKKWTVIAVICNKFLHNYITDHLVSSCVSK